MAKTSKSSNSSAASRALVVIVLAVAIVVALLIPTEQDRKPTPTDARLFHQELLAQSPLGDRVFVDDGEAGVKYAFGRWKEPIKDLSFHLDADWKLSLPSVFTTKYWHYSSVNTDRFFVGAAVVKLGYASDAVVYVVDKSTKDLEKFEFTGRLPGDLGLTFASSSIDASTCTSFTGVLGGGLIEFCFDKSQDEWTIKANTSMTGSTSGQVLPFTCDLRLKREEALTLLYPVGNDSLRPAYVHKGAGSPVSGTMQLGSVRLDTAELSTPALGAIDWTRSQALRCTRWNWASSSFKAKVTTTVEGHAPTVDTSASVGINLSKHVYDINGESQENAVWINGKVYVVRGVDFTVPTESPVTQTWQIETSPTLETDERINLQFTPSGGSREDHTHLLIIESDFVQPYGVFNGEITFKSSDAKTTIRIEVVDAFGVVEDHFALW